MDGPLPIEILFPLVFLAPVLVLAAWGALKGGARRASPGPITLTDHDDGLKAFGAATLLAAYLMLAGASLVGGGLLHFLKSPVLALLGLGLGGGLMAVTWYFYARRLKVMGVAKAGELVVPHWPLRQGERVQVAYGRAVKPTCRLRRLHAELQLIETCTRMRNGEQVHEVRTLERHDLGEGGARQTPEGLHALFDVDVPPPEGSHPRTGLAAFWAMLGRGPKRHWRVHVHLDVEGLPDRDSQFTLVIVEASAAARRPRPSRAA